MVFEYHDINDNVQEIKTEEYVELLDKSIEHYERMIEYVSTLDPNCRPNLQVMRNAIHVNWQAGSCVLCNKFEACYGCPIYEFTGYSSCKHTPWYNLSSADTWHEWLIAGKEELDYLTMLRDYYANL